MRYNVNAAALGDGKMTRCSNCGHSWFQQPVSTQATGPSRPIQLPSRGYQPPQMPQPGYPPQPMYPQPPGYPPQPQAQPAYAPMHQGGPPPYPPAPMPESHPAATVDPMSAPPPTPAPPAQPEPEPIPVREPEPEPEPEPIPEPAPEPEPVSEPEPEPEEEVGLSAAELDEMFGDDDEPEVISSMVDSDQNEDEPDLIDPNELDELPDPEPIPQVFTVRDGDDDENDQPAKRSIGKIAGIAAGVSVVAILIGAVALHRTIVNLLPATAGIYAMVGLGGEKLGAGLEIKKVTSARETEQGQDVMIVRGIVGNISEVERDVPLIRVRLYDGDGIMVQDTVAAPIKNKLAPKTTVSFKARLVEPSPLARRLEVIFAKADENHGEAPKKAAH